METFTQELPLSTINLITYHVNDLRRGRVRSKKYIKPSEFTMSKFLRSVYNSYSFLYNWISYEDYITILITDGFLSKDKISYIYQDQDFCPEPITGLN